MNKAILFLFACILATSLVLAVGPGSGNDLGTGSENPELTESGQGTGQGLQENIEQETQNKGNETQLQTEQRTQIKSGTYLTEKGEELEIESGERIKLKIRDVEAHSYLSITEERIQNRTQLKVQLSNGRNAEIKIMPDTASETALARLRLKVCNETNNCTIQLKETGQGNQTKATYEIKAEKQVKVFGLIEAKMKVEAQVDAENGEVVQEKRPWWSFLASEA